MGLGAAAVVLAATGAGLEVWGSRSYSPVAPAPLPVHSFKVGGAEAGAGPTSGAASAPTVPEAPAGLAPDHVSVPSLGIDAVLSPQAVTAGKLGIPADVQTVGWWTGGGALDGPTGTVLLAGHVDWVGQGDGALYPLANVEPRAVVYVTDATGSVSAWSVTSSVAVVKQALPQTIFAATGPRRLVIVTCGGPFDATTGHYLDNVVVTAEPAEISGSTPH